MVVMNRVRGLTEASVQCRNDTTDAFRLLLGTARQCPEIEHKKTKSKAFKIQLRLMACAEHTRDYVTIYMSILVVPM